MIKIRFNDLPRNIRIKIADYCWEQYGDVVYTPPDSYPQPSDTAFEELFNCKLSNAVDCGWVLNFTNEAYTMFLLKWG